MSHLIILQLTEFEREINTSQMRPFLQKLLLEVRCIYSFLNVDFHISIKSWKCDTSEKGLKEAMDEVA